GRAQHAARQHEGARPWEERYDIDVDALETGRRSLKIPVVDREHDGSPARRLEYARQATLHPPIEGGRTLQVKWLGRRRHVEVKILGILDVFEIGHDRFSCGIELSFGVKPSNDGAADRGSQGGTCLLARGACRGASLGSLRSPSSDAPSGAVARSGRP